MSEIKKGELMGDGAQAMKANAVEELRNANIVISGGLKAEEVQMLYESLKSRNLVGGGKRADPDNALKYKTFISAVIPGSTVLQGTDGKLTVRRETVASGPKTKTADEERAQERQELMKAVPVKVASVVPANVDEVPGSSLAAEFPDVYNNTRRRKRQ